VHGQYDEYKPDDVEYYGDEKHDPDLRTDLDEDEYKENYYEETRKAKAKKPSVQETVVTGNMYTPELRDYTLGAEFRDPFETKPKVST